MSMKKDFLKSLVSPLLDEVGRNVGKQIVKVFFGDQEKKDKEEKGKKEKSE